MSKWSTGLAPAPLSRKLTLKPNSKLQNSNKKLLIVPRTNLKNYGDRCFSVVGPKLWNSLPKQLRQDTNLD